MSTKMLSVLAAVVAIIAVLLFLAWSAQRTLEKGLPPKDTSAANRAEGFLFASDFAQKTGGEIYGVLGTGSMAPYIPAGAPTGTKAALRTDRRCACRSRRRTRAC